MNAIYVSDYFGKGCISISCLSFHDHVVSSTSVEEGSYEKSSLLHMTATQPE